MPAASEAHVWRVTEDASPGTKVLWDLLDEVETRRASRFVRPEDARRFVLSHAAVRLVLARYVDCEPHRLRFDRTCRCGQQHGKPILVEPAAPSLHFSLTHTSDLALIAVAGARVGIDVETVIPARPVVDLAAECMSERELEVMRGRSPADQVREFFDAWTKKEAYLKAVGTGLSGDIKRVEVLLGDAEERFVLDGEDARSIQWTIVRLSPEEGHAAALAVEHWIRRIDWFSGDCLFAGLGDGDAVASDVWTSSLFTIDTIDLRDDILRVSGRPGPDDADHPPVEVEVDYLTGEPLSICERLVVSPISGRFMALSDQTSPSEGDLVVEGQTIGVVTRLDETLPVTTRFTGRFMGLMAQPGELLREGQPIAWVRVR